MTPVLTLSAVAILAVMHGGELLYLRIWHDSFGVIWAHYPYCVIHHAVTYTCAGFKSTREGNSRQTKLLGGLSYEKIWRYNNSGPYMMARWLPQQISLLIFLVLHPETITLGNFEKKKGKKPCKNKVHFICMVPFLKCISLYI